MPDNKISIIIFIIIVCALWLCGCVVGYKSVRTKSTPEGIVEIKEKHTIIYGKWITDDIIKIMDGLKE